MFACLQTDAYDAAVYTPEQYETGTAALLAEIDARAVQRRDIGVTSQDKLLALSTCADAETNGRVVVFGRLCPINEGDERP